MINDEGFLKEGEVMNADVPEENRLRWLTEANWLPVNSFPAIIII